MLHDCVPCQQSLHCTCLKPGNPLGCTACRHVWTMTQPESPAKLGSTSSEQSSPLGLAVLSKEGAGWSAMETTSCAVLLVMVQAVCACTGIDPLKEAVH